MGIIINDTIKMDTGIELKDAYERYVNIRSEKEGEIIIISELYQSANARYNDMKPIAYNQSIVKVDKDTFDKKFGDLLYSTIKSNYTKTKDVLKDPVTDTPEITKSEVEGDDIVIEFTTTEPIAKMKILSHLDSEFPCSITNTGNDYKLIVKDYKLTGRDISKMKMWIKSDNKIESKQIDIVIDKWVSPFANIEDKKGA